MVPRLDTHTIMGMERQVAKVFGQVLRKQRHEAGLSQEMLAFDADLQRTYISVLELGQQVPSLVTVFKLSSALKISTSDIMDLLEKEMKKARIKY